MADENKGRWVTINGAHVLIKKGQTVNDAIKEKFGDKKAVKKTIKDGKHQYSMDGELYEDMDKDSYNELDAEEETNFDENIDSDISQKDFDDEEEYHPVYEVGDKVNINGTEGIISKVYPQGGYAVVDKNKKIIGEFDEEDFDNMNPTSGNSYTSTDVYKLVKMAEKDGHKLSKEEAEELLHQSYNDSQSLREFYNELDWEEDAAPVGSSFKNKKKNFKDTPEWKAMMEEYEASKNGHSFSDLDAIEGWIDRKPWELSRSVFDNVANRDLSKLNFNDPNNTWPAKAKAQTDFYNKYKDILTKQIDYDTQRNSDYREFLNSDMFKNYRLEQLLGDKELKKYDMQNSLRKLFNDKYGYDENEKAWFQDFDYDEIDQGKRNGFYSTLDKNSPDWEEQYYKFLDNLPINKKKTLVRLLGNGDIDLDDIINYVKKGK